MNASQWFLDHHRNRARSVGTFTVARQLRKQGVPLHVALAVLCKREPPLLDRMGWTRYSGDCANAEPQVPWPGPMFAKLHGSNTGQVEGR